jgi:threonine dehydratase
MAAGKSVTIEPNSAADGLNGPYAGPNCVRTCLDLGVENVLVSEEDLKEGFRFVYGRMKLAGELAGAATAAALLAGKVQLQEGNTVAAVVSGGNVAPQTAAAILAEQ